MMQAWWSFCICSVIYVLVSLATPRPPDEKIKDLTWDHPLAVITQGKLESLTDPRLLAALLFAVVAILYYVFR